MKATKQIKKKIAIILVRRYCIRTQFLSAHGGCQSSQWRRKLRFSVAAII
jgi:hypothetical protein